MADTPCLLECLGALKGKTPLLAGSLGLQEPRLGCRQQGPGPRQLSGAAHRCRAAPALHPSGPGCCFDADRADDARHLARDIDLGRGLDGACCLYLDDQVGPCCGRRLIGDGGRAATDLEVPPQARCDHSREDAEPDGPLQPDPPPAAWCRGRAQRQFALHWGHSVCSWEEVYTRNGLFRETRHLAVSGARHCCHVVRAWSFFNERRAV